MLLHKESYSFIASIAALALLICVSISRPENHSLSSLFHSIRRCERIVCTFPQIFCPLLKLQCSDVHVAIYTVLPKRMLSFLISLDAVINKHPQFIQTHSWLCERICQLFNSPLDDALRRLNGRTTLRNISPSDPSANMRGLEFTPTEGPASMVSMHDSSLASFKIK